MEKLNIEDILSKNSYPGRGIIIGKQPKREVMVIAYFIMGRSENSRNRIFEENERGGIRTKAFDETKLIDPKLIIYNPVLTFGNTHIVTNGNQTDTIYDYLSNGKTSIDALMTREFEGDEPILTPRISAVLNENGDYMLSILKANEGTKKCLRFFYEYEAVTGLGHLIHTYKYDGNVPPSFEGEPKSVEIKDMDIDEWSQSIWKSLNENNKISLFTRFVNLNTHEYESRIINKNI